MPWKRIALVIGVFLSVAISVAKAVDVELTDATYAKWRGYILPSAEELAWQEIPWRASFWDAVVEAQRRDRPILLWTMNGHPLCNT